MNPQQDKAFLYFMVPFAALMAVAVPIIVLWTRMSLPKYVGRWNRKKGPPEAGHTVTLVLTDVEGSTELWEAFQEVLSAHSNSSVRRALADVAWDCCIKRHSTRMLNACSNCCNLV